MPSAQYNHNGFYFSGLFLWVVSCVVSPDHFSGLTSAHRKMRERCVILDDFIIADVMARHDEPQSAPSEGNRDNQNSFQAENK